MFDLVFAFAAGTGIGAYNQKHLQPCLVDTLRVAKMYAATQLDPTIAKAEEKQQEGTGYVRLRLGDVRGRAKKAKEPREVAVVKPQSEVKAHITWEETEKTLEDSKQKVAAALNDAAPCAELDQAREELVTVRMTIDEPSEEDGILGYLFGAPLRALRSACGLSRC